jgi:DNA repair protein RadC
MQELYRGHCILKKNERKGDKTMLNHEGFYSLKIEKKIEPNSDMPLIKPIQDTKQIKGDALNGPEDVFKVMRFLEKADREMLYSLHLDAKNRIIAMELISMGSLTANLIHPREIFKGAILNNSVSVILVHNHPSGDAEPSRLDLDITERVIKAGEILGIPVVDHVVIGDGDYKSVKTCIDYAEQSKEMTKRKHTDSAINALIRANENLKGKESLTTAEIKSLSKTLRKSAYKMFLSRGVTEAALRICYGLAAEKITGKLSRR